MIFETDRLILRPWYISDANRLYTLAKNPNVGPITGWPPHKDEDESRRIIENVLSDDKTFAIVLKSENQIIGSIGLHKPAHNLDIDEDALELGYWLGEDYWGYGYAPEASRYLISWAFDALGCDTIWAGYFEGNYKSQRVQEKLGFIADHVDNNNTNNQLGEVKTIYFNKLNKYDWNKRKNKD